MQKLKKLFFILLKNGNESLNCRSKIYFGRDRKKFFTTLKLSTKIITKKYFFCSSLHQLDIIDFSSRLSISV